MAKFARNPTDGHIPPDLIRHNEPISFAAEPYIWHTVEFRDDVAKVATGKGIKVCVGDTGGTDSSIYANEPFAAKDFTGGNNWRDRNGHGSHVQGSIAGLQGLSFAPDAQIAIAKGLSDSGSGSDVGLANGIVWAADIGCHIYSGSWGSNSRSQRTVDAIAYFYANGGLICNISAGNAGDGGNTVGWPAKIDGKDQPFAVAALRGSSWSDLQRASFSSVGSQVDVTAPGQQIRSIRAGTRDQLTDMSGTSMSCPVTSSIMACVLEIMLRQGYPIPFTVDDWISFYSKIPDAFIDLGSPGDDKYHGHGAIYLPAVIEWLAKGAEGLVAT